MDQPTNKNDLFLGVSKEKVWVPILLGFFVLLLWSLSAFTLNNDGSEDRGTFGDMFGAINALFSGLAFAGIIYTIILQSKELKLQRDGLALTRDEIKGQKEELQEQNKTLAIQRFESSYFNLLNLYGDVLNTLYFYDYSTAIRLEKKGRDVFPVFWDSFVNRFPGQKMYPDSSIDDLLVSREFKFFYDESSLAQYFRIVYRIFVFVDAAPITKEEKSFYLKIFRASFSNQELLVIFYNCIFSGYGANMVRFIEDYNFFDNLPWEQVLHKDHLKRFKIEAYGALQRDHSFRKSYDPYFEQLS